MNIIFNKSYCKKKLFFLMIILLLSGNSIAQSIQAKGPFYNVPDILDGNFMTQIWNDNSIIMHSFISMSSTYPFNNVYDGILVNFVAHVQSSNEAFLNYTFASFYSNYITGNQNVPIIQVCYWNKSIKIKRYYDNNKYYEYKVYDQLFENQGFYDIKLYITANFIFIVTKNTTTGGYYASPIFFGLDRPNEENMANFLARNATAQISLGQLGGGLWIFNVKLYAFYYNKEVGRDNYNKPTYDGLLPRIKNWIEQLYVN